MDFDNMLSAVGNPLTAAGISYIMEKLLQLGQLEHAGIYTDVRHIATAQNNNYDLLIKAYILGFKTIHCPKLNGAEIPKDTVEENLAHDVYDLLENRPDINTFVFATHDRNFLPVINRVKQRRKTVIVVMNSPTGSKCFELIANQVIKIVPPIENRAVQQDQKSLREFLSHEYDSPAQMIETVDKQGLADNQDFKIALDTIIAIDSMKPGQYAFRYYMDWLKASCVFSISKHQFRDDIMTIIIRTLINCDVLPKRQDDVKTFYPLNREHFFVQIALNPGHLESVKALFKD